MDHPFAIVTHAVLGVPNNENLLIAEPGKDLSIKEVSQCGLSVCAKTYHISVSSGVPSINTTFLDYGEYFTAWYSGATCWKPRHGAPVMDQPHFNRYKTNWENTTDSEFCPIPEPGLLDPLAGVRSYIYQTFPFSGWSDFGLASTSEAAQKVVDIGLKHVMDKVAASLAKLSLDQSNRTVIGTVSHFEVIVVVDWKWDNLARYASSFWYHLFSVGHLGKSKTECQPVEIIRGTRTISYSDDDLWSDSGEDPPMSQMEHMAKSVNARLQFSDTGRRLMRERQPG